MADLQEYKCPNCGADLEFNSSIQKMKCPYCDSELDMSSLKELDEQLKTQTDENMTWSTQAGGEWDTGEIDQLSVYVCNSCGGEIVADESTAATSCPFCDNPVVMMGRFAVDFQTAYLAGYLADKYDVSSEDSISHANRRVKQSTEDAFEDTVTGFSTVTPESSNIRLINGSTKYVLYPVWLLNTTWKGKKFVFAMNGQTGKFVGDLPLDKQAYRRWLIGLGVVASIVSYAAVWLIHIL
ncbi:DNA-directed RNA polymerase subunit P [Streptococcus constellatus]|uniref:DNA-directed RNA polymerase subunit P n=1 Tax=Streptococcus constellatus TaxID=76860 RepID=A0A564SQ91_STRCV|nr:hypothetical protein [Streptococcus constellatus]VUW93250.1 DNA-directed RNA polymerase subunit P [Streptococcus gordonii]VUW97336.1 DNA-directed RNA polymerase subunit P [Streptococcus constellatus]